MTPDSLRIALRGVGINKLRSALTVLGILIGVGAVIVLVAVGTGSSQAIQKRIQSLGTNTLLVQNRGRGGPGAQRTGTQATSIQINDADIAALNDKTQAPDIASASARIKYISAVRKILKFTTPSGLATADTFAKYLLGTVYPLRDVK